jgi:hypothetical protein
MAEVHATSMTRLSKIETADDPADVVKIESGYEIDRMEEDSFRLVQLRAQC